MYFNIGPLGEYLDNRMGGNLNPTFGQAVGGYPGVNGFGGYPNYGNSFGAANNRLEKKCDVDLNGDGFIGGEGLGSKLEKITHVDLNGDGIIGRLPGNIPVNNNFPPSNYGCDNNYIPPANSYGSDSY
ncbi:unnamed protein product [Rotaria socialis]|uniref:Uncharacterized protein n=1 Tax=Rotaria socialis TaxID=392032 RepID=A0A820TS04_9BILA|nr:unnamed protein product [Rotaria socialis]